MNAMYLFHFFCFCFCFFCFFFFFFSSCFFFSFAFGQATKELHCHRLGPFLSPPPPPPKPATPSIPGAVGDLPLMQVPQALRDAGHVEEHVLPRSCTAVVVQRCFLLSSFFSAAFHEFEHQSMVGLGWTSQEHRKHHGFCKGGNRARFCVFLGQAKRPFGRIGSDEDGGAWPRKVRLKMGDAFLLAMSYPIGVLLRRCGWLHMRQELTKIFVVLCLVTV